MKKAILTGILSLLPMISYSPENVAKYIPMEEKLREIENDSTKVDCAYKAWRYYINLKANGYNANLVTGWLVEGGGVLHMYLRDPMGRILDPIIKVNKDGEITQGRLNYEDAWVFEDDVTIIESLRRKSYKKKDTKTIKSFFKKNPKFIKRKMTIEERAKLIEDYCKKDSSAWEYYKKNIEKK